MSLHRIKTRYLVAIFFFLLLIIAGSALSISRLPSSEAPIHDELSATSNPSEAVSVNLESSDTWTKDNSATLSIKLSNPEEPLRPDGFSLAFSYDPALLSVQKISTGNLWSAAIVLEENIDNTQGYVNFTHASSFSATPGPGSELATVTFLIAAGDVGSGTIKLTDQSEAGKRGYEYLFPLISDPYQVVIQ